MLDPGEWSEWSSERRILISGGRWIIAVLLAVFKIQVVQCRKRYLNASPENLLPHTDAFIVLEEQLSASYHIFVSLHIWSC